MERNGVWTEMGKLRTEAEMPEMVVKDGNVDGVDGAKNGKERP